MKKILISSLLIVMMISGCAGPKEEDTILVRIGDRNITLREINDRIQKLPSHYQDVVNKNKKKFLGDVVIDELFYEEAVRKGLHKEKETRDVIREAKKKILMAKLIKEEIEDKVRITDDMLLEYYEENRGQFMTPELWRSSHILVDTEEEAREILEKLSKGENFESIARERSQDATAPRGGDIGYFTMGQLVPDFERACLELEIGQVSGIVKTKFGCHIIKLTDRKKSVTEKFSSVRETVSGILQKTKRRELFNNLVNRLKESYRVKEAENIDQILGDTEEEENSSEEIKDLP
ncbi:MAG: peptidylprolyl isomerase [Candidatus Omnitrophota bacterium]